jgi:Glycosyl hydrolases family 28
MKLRLTLVLNLCASLFCLSLLSPLRAAPVVNKLIVYPVTEGMPQNADFTVKVRTPGQNWQDLPTYLVKVAQGIDIRPPAQETGTLQNAQGTSQSTPRTNMGSLNSSMTAFDFSGTVEVSIRYNNGTVESTRVRPLSYGILSSVDGNTITFSLSQPRNISVEVNGDIFHNLQLFANPIEVNRPDSNDPNVIYFGPGVHSIGSVLVPSGKTVYLAAGALVEGAFVISHAENVRILGRGTLCPDSLATSSGRSDQLVLQDGALPNPTPSKPMLQRAPRTSRRDAVLIEYSKNIEVDGITEVPSTYTVLVGQSQHVTLRNIKSFSAGGNNDGIDIFTSSDVLVDGVFMRNSDDTIAIYGHRWNYYGDVKDVTVQNSTLWADVAHPILVGTHGDSTDPDTLEDLKFLNIDILDQREPQLDYQGCMSLNAGDSNLIRNVRFENIRVEDFREGQLVNLRVFFNKKYNTSPGRGIEDVLFKDVTYNGTHANPSIIAGYDDSREIKNIVFENLKINGRVISDDMPGKPGFYKTGDLAEFFVGEHVENLVFRRAPMTDSQGNLEVK